MTEEWICCQLGAREHYSIPRALYHAGSLGLLITDLWIGPRLPWNPAPASLRQRYHAGLQNAPITSMNWRAFAFEAAARARWRGWKRIQERNRWFQRNARTEMQQWVRRHSGGPVVVFSYSYTAREVFALARDAGWTAVLGQIDGGPVEEQLVRDLTRRGDGGDPHWEAAPTEYWEEWREECRLADRIIVNSSWARGLLLDAGIPNEKLHVIPLAYEAAETCTPAARAPAKCYPSEFSATRPLRILFLGQVNIRKGISAIFEAIPLLRGEPVEFRIVGPIQAPVPRSLARHPMVRFTGPVPRAEAAQHYQWADLFVFPTFSDGFGLTQLEAQAWKVPVLASRFCGEVVQNRRNGYLLEQVSGEAIAQVIKTLLRAPREIEKMSAASGIEKRFTLAALAESLLSLGAGARTVAGAQSAARGGAVAGAKTAEGNFVTRV